MPKKQKRGAPERRGLDKGQKRRIVNIVGTTAMTIVLGLALYAVMFRGAQRPSRQLTRQMDQQADTAGRKQSECPTRPGEPWEYDRESRCYFDPSPGHGHWHVGQPPPPAERAARLPPGVAPAAPRPAPSPVASDNLPPGASPEGD